MSAPDYNLSPDQQELLRAALVSNQPSASTQRASKNTSPSIKNNQRNSFSFPSGSMSDQTIPGSGHLDYSDDSPYLDFIDGDGDDSFNFDTSARMIGDLPEDNTSSHDLHDKRKSIGDGDDDDEGGGKRREGEDKVGKKPGRKPLTSEPTTKRKAQNRAAQRAFRERKEKHLKDLETKVEDLEKASESTNQENGILRAQVERLQIELKEYRKRLSWVTNSAGRPQQPAVPQGRGSVGGNDFSFEFPKFGDLPTAKYTSPNSNPGDRGNTQKSNSKSFSTSPAPVPISRNSASSVNTLAQAPRAGSIGNSPVTNNLTASPAAQSHPGKEPQGSVDSLSSLFSPSILEATRHASGYFSDASASHYNLGRQSVDSFGTVPGLISHTSTNTDSPGSNADSQQHVSSIGTSPEPLFSSPSNRHEFNLDTISENDPITNAFGTQNLSTDLDATNFDWLAQQNGGSFDPVLFGDYRETQDNILSQDFGSFFNEAYPLPELGSPKHNYSELPAPATGTGSKTDLMRQVEAAKNGEELGTDGKPKMLTCNKIWDRLQSMEKFRNGEIDIDNLCSELRSKAKCSEGGVVVDEKHVDKFLNL